MFLSTRSLMFLIMLLVNIITLTLFETLLCTNFCSGASIGMIKDLEVYRTDAEAQQRVLDIVAMQKQNEENDEEGGLEKNLTPEVKADENTMQVPYLNGLSGLSVNRPGLNPNLQFTKPQIVEIREVPTTGNVQNNFQPGRSEGLPIMTQENTLPPAIGSEGLRPVLKEMVLKAWSDKSGVLPQGEAFGTAPAEQTDNSLGGLPTLPNQEKENESLFTAQTNYGNTNSIVESLQKPTITSAEPPEQSIDTHYQKDRFLEPSNELSNFNEISSEAQMDSREFGAGVTKKLIPREINEQYSNAPQTYPVISQEESNASEEPENNEEIIKENTESTDNSKEQLMSSNTPQNFFDMATIEEGNKTQAMSASHITPPTAEENKENQLQIDDDPQMVSTSQVSEESQEMSGNTDAKFTEKKDSTKPFQFQERDSNNNDLTQQKDRGGPRTVVFDIGENMTRGNSNVLQKTPYPLVRANEMAKAMVNNKNVLSLVPNMTPIAIFETSQTTTPKQSKLATESEDRENTKILDPIRENENVEPPTSESTQNTISDNVKLQRNDDDSKEELRVGKDGSSQNSAVSNKLFQLLERETQPVNSKLMERDQQNNIIFDDEIPTENKQNLLMNDSILPEKLIELEEEESNRAASYVRGERSVPLTDGSKKPSDKIVLGIEMNTDKSPNRSSLTPAENINYDPNPVDLFYDSLDIKNPMSSNNMLFNLMNNASESNTFDTSQNNTKIEDPSDMSGDVRDTAEKLVQGAINSINPQEGRLNNNQDPSEIPNNLDGENELSKLMPPTNPLLNIHVTEDQPVQEINQEGNGSPEDTDKGLPTGVSLYSIPITETIDNGSINIEVKTPDEPATDDGTVSASTESNIAAATTMKSEKYQNLMSAVGQFGSEFVNENNDNKLKDEQMPGTVEVASVANSKDNQLTRVGDEPNEIDPKVEQMLGIVDVPSMMDTKDEPMSKVEVQSTDASKEEKMSRVVDIPSTDASKEEQMSNVVDVPSTDASKYDQVSSAVGVPSTDASKEERMSSIVDVPSTDASKEEQMSSEVEVPSTDALRYEQVSVAGVPRTDGSKEEQMSRVVDATNADASKEELMSGVADAPSTTDLLNDKKGRIVFLISSPKELKLQGINKIEATSSSNEELNNLQALTSKAYSSSNAKESGTTTPEEHKNFIKSKNPNSGKIIAGNKKVLPILVEKMFTNSMVSPSKTEFKEQKLINKGNIAKGNLKNITLEKPIGAGIDKKLHNDSTIKESFPITQKKPDLTMKENTLALSANNQTNSVIDPKTDKTVHNNSNQEKITSQSINHMSKQEVKNSESTQTDAVKVGESNAGIADSFLNYLDDIVKGTSSFLGLS